MDELFSVALANRARNSLHKCNEGLPTASVTVEQVEDVVVATLESTPANATHWSRASMAKRSGLSESTIGRIWRAFGLQPRRVEDFKLSNDPLFVDSPANRAEGSAAG